MQNYMKICEKFGQDQHSCCQTAVMNNDGTIFEMTFNVEHLRMNFKVTDKLKNYIDKLTV